MADNLIEAGTRHLDEIQVTNRDLTEKALQMRCLGYLAHVKAKLLTETIFEFGQSKKKLKSVTDEVLGKRDIIARQKAEIEERNLELEKMTRDLQTSNEALKLEITDRKIAEIALRESELKYRDIFENVSDFLYFHDLEGYFIETNLAAKKNSGYSETDLANMNIKEPAFRQR